jgi:hypothetical protein
MITKLNDKSIVYRYVTVAGLPFPVAVVRDPYQRAYTAYMPELSSIVSEGETVNEATERLKMAYKHFLDYKSK